VVGEVDAFFVLTGAWLIRAVLVHVCPAVFDAGETFAVDVDGALGAGAFAENVRVNDRCCHEERCGSDQPPGGEGVSLEGEPGQGEGCEDEEEAEVAEAEMDRFEVSYLLLTGLLALAVLLGGGGW